MELEIVLPKWAWILLAVAALVVAVSFAVLCSSKDKPMTVLELPR